MAYDVDSGYDVVPPIAQTASKPRWRIVSLALGMALVTVLLASLLLR